LARFIHRPEPDDTRELGFEDRAVCPAGARIMSSDTEKHRELLSGLKQARGKADGSFEAAITAAFEHVFEHLERLNGHVSSGGPGGADRHLEPDESATLR
jgi:hypothetical protein